MAATSSRSRDVSISSAPRVTLKGTSSPPVATALSRLLGLEGRLVARHAVDDLLLGLDGVDPDADAHPLARLEILVVLEEVRDLARRDLRQVTRRLHIAVK